MAMLWRSGVVLAAVAVYTASLHGAMCFDDNYAIVNNQDLRSETPLRQLLEHDFWGQDISRPDSHKSYRPLTVLSFRLNHALHNLEPFGYHVGNIALHAANSLLVFDVGVSLGQSPAAAGLAALLFAVHPVHTESVAGLVGRADVLSGFFFILSLLAYTRAARATHTSWWPLLGALVCFFCSVLAKETGFTILPVLFAYDVLLVHQPSPSSTGAQQARRGEARIVPVHQQSSAAPSVPLIDRHRALGPLILRLIIIAGFGLGYVWARGKITVIFQLQNYRLVENPIAFAPFEVRVMSNAYLYARYAWLLVWPFVLSVDYSFNAIPLVEHISDVRNAVSVAAGMLIISTAAAAAVSIVRGTARQGLAHRVLFSVAVLVATFIPASNVFVYVGTMLAERLLYLPSLGFCLLVGDLVSFALASSFAGKEPQSTRTWRYWFVIAAVFGLTVAYSVRTHTRSQDWESEETLFTRAGETTPNSAKVQLNLGILRRRYNDWEGALAHFEQSLRIYPEYCEPKYWKGLTLVNSDRVTEGISVLSESVECVWTAANSLDALNKIYSVLLKDSNNSPVFLEQWGTILGKVNASDASRVWRMAGMAWRLESKYEKAFNALRTSVNFDPASCESNYWAGATAIDLNRDSAALPFLRVSARCDHGMAASFALLVPAFRRLRNDTRLSLPEREQVLLEMVQLVEQCGFLTIAHDLLAPHAFSELEEGRFANAVQHLSQLVRLRPDSCDSRVALAQALRALGRTQAAKPHAEAALRCEDPDQRFRAAAMLATAD